MWCRHGPVTLQAEGSSLPEQGPEGKLLYVRGHKQQQRHVSGVRRCNVLEYGRNQQGSIDQQHVTHGGTVNPQTPLMRTSLPDWLQRHRTPVLYVIVLAGLVYA